MSYDAVICLGSNSGRREDNISGAVNTLMFLLEDVKMSDLYETPDACGGMNRYLNLVMSGHCDMSRKELEAACKMMELIAGRDEEARNRGEVPLDVDIVVWGGKVLRTRDYNQKFFTIGYGQIQDTPSPS